MGKLTPKTVLGAKPGRLGDGEGLYVLTKPTGTQTWMLRVQVDGKRRDVGLGTVDVARLDPKKGVVRNPIPAADIPILQRKLLTLAEARQKADILRRAAKDGLNPVAERDKARSEIPDFKKAAKIAHDALRKGWVEKGAKTFLSSLANHAFPVLGNIRVDRITSADITAALTPIWMSKPDMARKVRQRIGTVLNFAHGKGWRASEAPKKSVTVGLPSQPAGEHYKSMPYADVPAFMRELRAGPPTKGRRALMLHILTAARGGEVRRARWGQIDFERGDWNRPAEIMKGRKAPPHTVTLSSAALALLNEIKGDRTPRPDDLIFPGERGPLMSDMTLSKVMRNAKRPYDPHGFRSSFRDWVAEQMPGTPDAVAEAAIAHIETNKVKAAYKRTAYIPERRVLLESWASYCDGGS